MKPPNRGYTNPTRTPYLIQSVQVEQKINECKPLPGRRRRVGVCHRRRAVAPLAPAAAASAAVAALAGSATLVIVVTAAAPPAAEYGQTTILLFLIR